MGVWGWVPVGVAILAGSVLAAVLVIYLGLAAIVDTTDPL